MQGPRGSGWSDEGAFERSGTMTFLSPSMIDDIDEFIDTGEFFEFGSLENPEDYSLDLDGSSGVASDLDPLGGLASMDILNSNHCLLPLGSSLDGMELSQAPTGMASELEAFPWSGSGHSETSFGGDSADHLDEHVDLILQSLFEKDILRPNRVPIPAYSREDHRTCNAAVADGSVSSTEGGYACQTKRCRERFLTIESLRSHCKDAHRAPYHCFSGECQWSFKHQKDLERHHKARHSNDSRPEFPCEYANCARSVKGFKRRDAMMRHLEKCHVNIDDGS